MKLVHFLSMYVPRSEVVVFPKEGLETGASPGGVLPHHDRTHGGGRQGDDGRGGLQVRARLGGNLAGLF